MTTMYKLTGDYGYTTTVPEGTRCDCACDIRVEDAQSIHIGGKFYHSVEKVDGLDSQEKIDILQWLLAEAEFKKDSLIDFINETYPIAF